MSKHRWVSIAKGHCFAILLSLSLMQQMRTVSLESDHRTRVWNSRSRWGYQESCEGSAKAGVAYWTIRYIDCNFLLRTALLVLLMRPTEGNPYHTEAFKESIVTSVAFSDEVYLWSDQMWDRFFHKMMVWTTSIFYLLRWLSSQQSIRVAELVACGCLSLETRVRFPCWARWQNTFQAAIYDLPVTFRLVRLGHKTQEVTCQSKSSTRSELFHL